MRTGGYTLPISQSDRSQRTFLNNDMPMQEHGWGGLRYGSNSLQARR